MMIAKKVERPGSKTGAIPRFVDPIEIHLEPSQPPTLPEMDFDEGITGIIILRPEGDDTAKDAEDDPIASARVG
jgi:hypothetical protein